MWQYNYIYQELSNDELMHYGRKGMKWGQNIFGGKRKSIGKTLSDWKADSQKKKIAKLKEKIKIKERNDEIKRLKSQLKNKPEKETKQGEKTEKTKELAPKTNTKKSVRDLSDAELRDVVKRLTLEKQYKDLQPKQVSKGKQALDTFLATAKTVNDVYNAANSLYSNYGKLKTALGNNKKENKKK